MRGDSSSEEQSTVESRSIIDPIHEMLEKFSHFPLSIEVLFNIQDIKSVRQYCEWVIISEEDLACASYSAERKGYLHYIQSHEWVPKHLKLGDDDRLHEQIEPSGEFSKKGKKIINKISHIFIERKVLTSHLFIKKDVFTRKEKWHIFYFTYRDLEDHEPNHWEQGSHIHFVNYLWANLKWEEVWPSLSQKEVPSYGVHLGFYDESEERHHGE